MRKSLAVLAASALGFGAVALASPAFASTPNWANTVVIPNTLTLTVTSPSTSITPNLGGEAYTESGANGMDWSNPADTVVISSNDTAGYDLTEAATSAFTSGTNVVPDTSVQLWDAGQGVYDTFDAAGDPVNIGQPVKVSGMQGANSGNGSLYSSGGTDVYPIGTGLTLPGNQPAGTYAASFTFSVVGS